MTDSTSSPEVNPAGTDDLRIASLRQLIAPSELISQLPLTDRSARFINEARQQCESILEGADDRLLVVMGPCSIHDTEAAKEYAERLRELGKRVKDDLFLVMRVYFEKTQRKRGWKGLINDPLLDESFRINKGLSVARGLLRDLAEMEVPAASEFLDTIIPQYYADLVSWGAIGAPSTESQLHRELASGLSMPVGFKNKTSGDYQIAIEAILASRQPHRFLAVTKSGKTAIVSTQGNAHCHVILRGGKETGPNYHAESIAEVREALEKKDLVPAIMVDCSHDNSRMDHTNQPKVCHALAEQIAGGDHSIRGLMMESHLNEGRQKNSTSPEKLRYGVSITDACVSWETSVEMIEELRDAVQRRRNRY